MARFAIIDIGSNTSTLAVYEGSTQYGVNRIYQHGETLRLIRQIRPDRSFSPAAMDRTVDTMRIFAQRAISLGAEHIEALRDDGLPGLAVAAHYGNWELPPLIMQHFGMKTLSIYRAANNPAVDAMIQDLRDVAGQDYAPKGSRAARDLLGALRAGGHVGLLVDQKQNTGIAVPFFGRDAMTAPAAAELALRFDCPVVPVRVERLGGAHFRFTAEAPFRLASTGDKVADVANGMRRIHAIFERWITERPDHWFWVHRRWPD